LNDKCLSRSRAAFSAATLGCMAAVGNTAAAATESDDEQAPLTFEVTPYVGYRLGGTLKVDTDTHVDVRDHVSFALALDLSTDQQSTQYELFYSRQSTIVGSPSSGTSDTIIEYLHIGGTVVMDDSSRFQPYIIGTVGATRFTPDSPPGHDRTYFSASFGGGFRIPSGHHFSLRLEARGFATVLNSNTAVFCRSDQSAGVCRIHASGSSFLQGELLAGVAYAF
jgi:hypothetical protein